MADGDFLFREREERPFGMISLVGIFLTTRDVGESTATSIYRSETREKISSCPPHVSSQRYLPLNFGVLKSAFLAFSTKCTLKGGRGGGEVVLVLKNMND